MNHTIRCCVVKNKKTIKLFRYFLIFLLIQPALSFADCNHKIIFLPKSHAIDSMTALDSTQEIDNQVASSQFKIANFIENKFPKTPIFTEQASANDFSLEQIPSDKREALKKYYLTIFPTGLPEKFSDLNDIQKKKLVDNGGEFVQLIRGKAQQLHRVIEDKSELESIFGPIQEWFKSNPSRDKSYPPEIAEHVYGKREQAALNQVNKFFQTHPDEHYVILIFGSNHNFNFYPEQFPSSCISIPSEFQDDWKGRYRVGPEGFSQTKTNTDITPENSAQ